MEIESPVVTGELKNEITTIEERTKTVAVRNPEERKAVFELIQLCKTKKKTIIDFFADMKKKAFEAHRAISAAEKAETDKLDAFERAGKVAMGQYDALENEKRLAMQRRLQAIADEKARVERAKIESEAARQRAIQAEAERKAAEARKAAENASKEEAARLNREAAAAEAKAAAANVKADAKTEAASFVQSAVVEVAAPEKIAGESTRKIYHARIIDAKLIPVEYFAGWIDPKKVDDFARATKGAVPIPGVEFYFESVMSVKTK
jgi:hypothetical protein